MQVLRADIMMDKLNRFWAHKNWKVRHGLLQFVAEAVCSAGEAVLAMPKDNSNWVLHKVIQLVGDPERWVGGISGPSQLAMDSCLAAAQMSAQHMILAANKLVAVHPLLLSDTMFTAPTSSMGEYGGNSPWK